MISPKKNVFSFPLSKLFEQPSSVGSRSPRRINKHDTNVGKVSTKE